MKYHDLLIERDGALVKVILNRPESKNTMSARMLKELKEVALSFRNDPDIRVVILAGASGKFSAGMDLKDPEVQKMSSGTMAERRDLVILGPELCRAWEETGPLTIVAVEGYKCVEVWFFTIVEGNRPKSLEYTTCGCDCYLR